MKIKLGNWTLFLMFKITNENVNNIAGEYLFNICIQKYRNGNNYLTGILTRHYGN